MPIGAAKSDSSTIIYLMGTIVIGVIAGLLLIYLFATMIYPEHF